MENFICKTLASIAFAIIALLIGHLIFYDITWNMIIFCTLLGICCGFSDDDRPTTKQDIITGGALYLWMTRNKDKK